MTKLQLHFNGNFPFKREEIGRILQAATQEKGLKDSLQSLAERTNLGEPKVGRIKSWTERAGLIKNNCLTSEGEIVWKLDPDLETNNTQWLLHFYLTFGDHGLEEPPTTPADWGAWSYFIYTFLPQRSKFTSNELLESTASVFVEKRETIATRIKFILRAYTNEQALSQCKFLTLKEDYYYTDSVQLPNPYLIAYFLAKLWQRDGNTTSVLSDDILQQKMGLAPILGIEIENLQQCLNELETLALIEQRRTVAPAQIIRRWDDNLLKLLEKAYAY